MWKGSSVNTNTAVKQKVWHVSEAPHDSGDDGRGKVQVQHLTRWCSSGGALTIAAQGSSQHVHHWVISQSWSTGTWTSLLHGGEGGFREYNTEPKHDILQNIQSLIFKDMGKGIWLCLWISEKMQSFVTSNLVCKWRLLPHKPVVIDYGTIVKVAERESCAHISHLEGRQEKTAAVWYILHYSILHFRSLSN